jgi:hypothetical protein
VTLTVPRVSELKLFKKEQPGAPAALAGCPTHCAVLKFASIMLCVRDVWELTGRAIAKPGEEKREGS